MGLRPVPDLLNGASLLLLPGGQPNQQALPQGGAQSIHHIKFPLGIPLPQLLRRHLGGITGRGQPGGEGQDEHILPRLKQGLHRIGVGRYIDGGGGGQLPRPEHIVKQRRVHLPIVRSVLIGLPLDGKAQGQDGHTGLPDHLRTQVGGGVG